MKILHTLPVLLLVILMAGCDNVSEETVTYEVVAMRNPSDVAMTMAPGIPQESRLGGKLIVGKKLTWIDGKTYAKWERGHASELPMGFRDPMLGDIYWQPLGTPGETRTERYRAGDELVGQVVYVDSQLALISEPAGAPVYVLEKALSKETALRMERALNDRKFDPGPVDGVIDEQTRRALGFYLEYLGVKYRFKTPVISSALLRELVGGDD